MGGYSGIRAQSMFNDDGAVPGQAKIWAGRVSAIDGQWTVDFSSAGFTAPPQVWAQASATGTAKADRNFASVRQDTITETACSGTASNAVTTGLLVATVLTNADCDIDVLALGV